MRTTTSLIERPAPAEVGELGIACDCVHCAPHAEDTGCHCDHPARWLVFFHHMCGKPGTNEDGCGVLLTLCDPCLEAAKGWAGQAASSVGAANGGRCFICAGGPLRCIDDIISVVAL